MIFGYGFSQLVWGTWCGTFLLDSTCSARFMLQKHGSVTTGCAIMSCATMNVWNHLGSDGSRKGMLFRMMCALKRSPIHLDTIIVNMIGRR